jgi:hypothetical protein
MSLITREATPAQISASRANSQRSTGPRSERGIAASSQSLMKPRPFSDVAARSMEALGERPGDFELMCTALSAAMEPRDAWEAAWVQDIAILRSRLERLQRAEIATMATERRRLNAQRQRAASPPTGSAGLEIQNLVGVLGFTGIPDSVMKFQKVIEYLHDLRDLISAQMFDQDITPYITILFGTTPGPQATLLKARYDTLANFYKEQRFEAIDEGRKLLLADVDKEIEHYEQLQSFYTAEHLDADQVQRDAELLLPEHVLEGIIRYETHLEDQIERKLRQFYARRREPLPRHTEARTAASEGTEAGQLACQTASAGSQS